MRCAWFKNKHRRRTYDVYERVEGADRTAKWRTMKSSGNVRTGTVGYPLRAETIDFLYTPNQSVQPSLFEPLLLIWYKLVVVFVLDSLWHSLKSTILCSCTEDMLIVFVHDNEALSVVGNIFSVHFTFHFSLRKLFKKRTNIKSSPASIQVACSQIPIQQTRVLHSISFRQKENDEKA